MSKTNKNKNKKNSKKWGVSNKGLELGTLIFKPFHPTPIQSHCFRFKIGSSITGLTILQSNIFAMYVLAISGTTARSIMSSMRIKYFRAIATGFSTSVIDELYIRDANAQGLVDPIDSTSTGQGNAHVLWRPNKKSLSSDWFNFNTGGSICIMSLPAGTTLEVCVDFVLGGAAGTISGASYTSVYTTGFMYSMGLDGAAGSINYQAIGMNQA